MHTQRARLATSLLGLAGLFASAAASAAVIHNETMNGDLSNAPGAPTAMGTLVLGASTVTGRLANNFENNTEDSLDAFSFVVAAGTQVSAIRLDFVRAPYANGAGILLGATGGANLGTLNTTLSGITSGGDLFTNAFFGFSGPLGAGDYTVELRGAGPSYGLSSYSLNLTVNDQGAQHSVPEPASGLLVAGSLLALAASRRRA